MVVCLYVQLMTSRTVQSHYVTRSLVPIVQRWENERLSPSRNFRRSKFQRLATPHKYFFPNHFFFNSDRVLPSFSLTLESLTRNTEKIKLTSTHPFHLTPLTSEFWKLSSYIFFFTTKATLHIIIFSTPFSLRISQKFCSKLYLFSFNSRRSFKQTTNTRFKFVHTVAFKSHVFPAHCNFRARLPANNWSNWFILFSRTPFYPIISYIENEKFILN